MMKAGAGAGWKDLNKVAEAFLQKPVENKAPATDGVSDGSTATAAKKSGPAKKSGGTPVQDSFAAPTSEVASKVRSYGLTNISMASDAASKMKLQLDSALESLSSAKDMATRPDGILRSATLQASMHESVAKFSQAGLSEAAATYDLGQMMVGAAEGGRLTPAGKFQGKDLAALDEVESRLNATGNARGAHEDQANATGKDVGAAMMAEKFLESFGISPRSDVKGALETVRSETDGLAMFDKKVADLGGVENAPPHLQPLLKRARGAIEERISGAHAGVLVEQQKMGFLDNTISQLVKSGSMTPGLQGLMVDSARKISDLQATAEKAKSVSAKDVVAVFNLRIADVKPDLGDAKVHAKASSFDANSEAQSSTSGAQAKANTKAEGPADGDTKAKQSGASPESTSTPEGNTPQSLSDLLFGASGLLQGAAKVVGKIFGPEAQAAGESNLRMVSDFVKDLSSDVGQGKGWLQAVGDLAKNAMEQLDQLAEEQRRTQVDTDAKATKA